MSQLPTIFKHTRHSTIVIISFEHFTQNITHSYILMSYSSWESTLIKITDLMSTSWINSLFGHEQNRAISNDLPHSSSCKDVLRPLDVSRLSYFQEWAEREWHMSNIYSHIQEELWRHTKAHLDVCSPNKLLINRTSLAELSRRENIKMHKRQTRDPHDFTSAAGNNVTV